MLEKLPLHSLYEKTRTSEKYRGRKKPPVDWCCYFVHPITKKRIYKTLGDAKKNHTAKYRMHTWIEKELNKRENKGESNIISFIEGYVEYSKQHHKPKSHARFRIALEWFGKFLSEVYTEVIGLNQLTMQMGETYKAWRRNHNKYKKKTSNRTINGDMDIIKTALTQAIKWEYLEKNPLRGINFPPTNGIVGVPVSRQRKWA